jgi:hypothetical protein
MIIEAVAAARRLKGNDRVHERKVDGDASGCVARRPRGNGRAIASRPPQDSQRIAPARPRMLQRVAVSAASLLYVGIMRLAPFIVLLVVLCGCASFPKQMTGQFNAQRGDFIVLQRDGALYWSPAAKTRDRLAFVGIGSPDKTDARLVSLVVPSSSPFLYSSVRFSPDYSRAIVDWGSSPRIREAVVGRSTEFARVSRK